MAGQDRDDEWVPGFLMLLAGIFGFGLQIYWFLRDGLWWPLSIIDTLKIINSTSKRLDWLYEPQSWQGIHIIMDRLSLPASLMVFGILVMLAARKG